MISEVDKNVVRKIPGVSNVIDARASAAQEQVKRAEDPTKVPYGFVCSKCKVSHTFTAMQLQKISDAGGRWVCPSPGCNEIYELKLRDSLSRKDGNDDGSGVNVA